MTKLWWSKEPPSTLQKKPCKDSVNFGFNKVVFVNHLTINQATGLTIPRMFMQEEEEEEEEEKEDKEEEGEKEEDVEEKDEKEEKEGEE